MRPSVETPQERLDRAVVALHGLASGDAFGERFFVDPTIAERWIAERSVPPGPWPYTDDTEMSLSVVTVLRGSGFIDQDALARAFAARYDPSRGYGPAMHRTLSRIARGEPWLDVARGSFDGQGSYGNGAAMRAAPVGAYFADDLDVVVEQAVRSAEVTHSHPEGIAGAVAVAGAAALAWKARQESLRPAPDAFLDGVLGLLTPGEVRSRLRRARDLAPGTPAPTAAAVLGSGIELSAQDTVPFALWCAAHHLDDYEAALWATVSGLGDRDTTCAIVGGIVASFVGVAGIPGLWLDRREVLPDWTAWVVEG
jgi:ADP-ribosylglycohydrolase